MPTPDVTFPLESLRVLPWYDPVVDRVGHDPRSPYVERCWLGVLGPSTTWLLRRMADHFDAEPDGFDLPLADTAAELGLAGFGGRHSPFMRALQRSCQFGLARFGTAGMAVRRRLPPLGQRQLERLPASVQRAHLQWVSHPSAPGARADRARVGEVAVALLGLGDAPDAVVRQLVAWGVAPPLAAAAVEAAVAAAVDGSANTSRPLPPAA